jgi:SCP-2 sterol transfer family
MAAYLSPDWVRAFNDALTGLDLRAAIAEAAQGSLTATDGTFAVAQVVTGGPDATVRTVLTVTTDGATLALDPDDALPANVTIVLAYEDALAMARGELDPADALAAGRVRVRGELAVLVAGQAVLAAASAELGDSLAALSD